MEPTQEFYDDCGSDAEDYEDALEELTKEEAKTAAQQTNPCVPSSNDIAQSNNEQSAEEQQPSESEHSNNVSDVTERLATTALANDTEENTNVTLSDGSHTSGSESEEEHTPLHEKLNEEDRLDPPPVDEDDEDKSDPLYIDEEALKVQDANMSDEDKIVKKDEAQILKAEGNEKFKEAAFREAALVYTEALRACPLCFQKERSIMYSNRGACHYRMELCDTSIKDCTKALELNPNYLKALLRRAECYEKTDKLDEALEDYNKVLEMDPSVAQARAACMRLPDQIKERNEKMKEEMMGKLKDLGNLVLRPFGLSTNNFNLQQDPNSGSYSVQFQQNVQK